GNRSDTLAQVGDEIFFFVFECGRELVDACPGLLVFELIETYERHRVDADVVGDDEFHAEQPDAVVREERELEGLLRIGHDKHGAGMFRQGQVTKIDLLFCPFRRTPVNETRRAFTAGNGDRIAIGYFRRGVAGAHNGRHTQLTRYDRG